MPKKSQPSVLKAAMLGQVDSARTQLAAGADPNEKDTDGRTPLHWACQEGHIKIIRLLIKSGAPVDTTDNLGFTPLVIAAGEGNCTAVKDLVKAGANANIRVHGNSDGTALHLACAWDHLDVAKLLVEKSDVDINEKDREGRTPLALVMGPNTKGKTGKKKLAEYLIAHGATR
jgi:uncharacterized protein